MVRPANRIGVVLAFSFKLLNSGLAIVFALSFKL